MKKSNTLLLLLLLIFAPSLEAQYGYGSPYGGRYGRQRSTLPQAQSPPKKAEPKTADELVDAQMPKIVEDLELDPFEEAVVRTTLVKYVQQRIELQILELEPQKMKEELEKIQRDQDAELKAGLPEEKYNSYIELQERGLKARKKKKKKKKKKDKS